MKKTISRMTALLFLLGTGSALGKMKMLSQADYALEISNSTIEIKEDGSSIETTTNRWIPFNAKGKEELAQAKVYFEPSRSKIKFVSAQTLSPSRYTFYPLGKNTRMTEINGQPIDITKEKRQSFPVLESTVQFKEIGIAKSGVQSTQAMIVPFTNLALRSSAEYSYIQESKPLIPGHYSQVFVYGQRMPEISGMVTLKSKKEIRFKVLDPGKYLKVTSTKDSGTYTLSIEVQRPIYFMPSEDEYSPYLSENMYPRVDVSTAASWGEIVKPLAGRYEKEIEKELPVDFEKILNVAKLKATDDERFGSVMHYMASSLTYAGDWSTQAGRYFPRGHKKLSMTKSGDCKDFATLLAGILRRMGYSANVALTYRGPGTDDFFRNFDQMALVPSLDNFNHALVYVKMKDGTERWLDPTNLVTDPQWIGVDIQGSPALILASLTAGPTKIPRAGREDSMTELTLEQRADGLWDVKGKYRIEGQGALNIRTNFRKSGTKATEDLISPILLLGYKPKVDPVLVYNLNSTVGPFDIAYTFQTETDNLLTKEKDLIFIPYSYRYQALSLATQGRLTGLFLGSPGESKSKTTIKGVKSPGDVSSNCFVLSPWYDIHRTVRDELDSVVVNDVIQQKTDRILKSDLDSEEFNVFMGEASACLRSQYVSINKKSGAKDEILLAQLDLAKAKEMSKKFNGTSGAGSLAAKYFLDKFLETAPDNAEARTTRAEVIFRSGYRSGENYGPSYLDTALADLNLVLKTNPENTSALVLRMKVLYYAKQTEQALADLGKLKKIIPTDPDVIYIAAMIAQRQGRLEDAEKWLLYGVNASKSDDDRVKNFQQLAGFYLDTREYQKATETYLKTLAMKPRDAWTWNNVSISYTELKKYDEAIAAAKKALGIMQFGAAQENLSRAFCLKADNLVKSMKTGVELGKAKTNIEESVFEGLKVSPNSEECLLVAARYFERRTFELKEKESAVKSAEYYTRLGQASGHPMNQIWASSMKQISKQLEAGVPFDDLSASAPSKMFQNMGSEVPADQKAVGDPDRLPASVKPTLVESK